MKKTLFGDGGVQGLDGDAHRHRKQMFMALMTPERIRQLADLFLAYWKRYEARWEEPDEVVLFDELQEILCRAVCEWSGVPLPESEVSERTTDLAAMIEASGAIAWRHWIGRYARTRCEGWIGNLIERVCARKLQVAEESAVYAISHHRDINGKLLDTRVAAVELINILRPTVAIARFIIFAALAMHEHPAERQRLQSGDDAYGEMFAQEVRRFYPFFPFVAARVRKDFDWNGYRFPKGRRVILDLYGTNHDARLWENPQEFRPERFRHWDKSPFDFIPQGGGDYYTGHRCPGEFITVELIKVSLDFLTNSIKYDVPPQDLNINLRRIPTLPESRFRIKNVRPV